MQCPGEIEVLGWMEGGLPPEVLDRLDTHLDHCDDCLAAVAALGKVRGTATAATDHERYAVGAELARGGMGQVFVATDRVLGRRVALKTVRDSVGAARFAREMRITARLQHPAIVPVYDAGAFPDGEPFYVMRHVEGRTLDRAAADATTLADRLALVPAVMTAIDAVAYAHDCGVIHRDLKPANVLVGRFGETIVLDWGLAKVTGDSVDPDATSSAEVIARGSPVDEPELTHAGAVLGTPAYMAPEQAVGEAADVRSDVYGLGALLYHVLSGAPPRRRIATAPLAPLATHAPGVPSELAAIVDRATAHEPEDRYASARELGEDLRHYLAGRLVAAHHYSVAALVRRWAARHRAALTAAIVALIAVVAIGVISIRRVLIARDDAEAARARAIASQAASDTQRGAAEQLVTLVLDDLRTRLEAMGRLDALVEVGRTVDDYFGKIPVRTGREGVPQLISRADALAVLGDARLALGDLDGAHAAFAREAELATEARSRSHDENTASAMCLSQLRLGDIARLRGDAAASRAAGQACVDVGLPGGPAKLQDLSIQALVLLAGLDRLEGAYDTAAGYLARAEPMAAALAATSPRGRELLAAVTSSRGNLALDRGDVTAARAAFASGVKRAEDELAADPGDVDAKRRLAEVLASVARVERRADDSVASAAAFRRSRELAQSLVDRDPDNLVWLRLLGMIESQYGATMLERDELADATVALAASHAIDQRLIRRNPDNRDWLRDTAVGALQLGDLERARKRPTEARAYTAEAVTVCERLAGEKPDDVEAQRDLAIALLHLGDLDREGGRAEAAATLGRSVAILRGLVEHSDTQRGRSDLVNAMLALADAQPGPAARATIAEAAAVIEPLRASAATDDAELQAALADIAEATATAAKR